MKNAETQTESADIRYSVAVERAAIIDSNIDQKRYCLLTARPREITSGNRRIRRSSKWRISAVYIPRFGRRRKRKVNASDADASGNSNRSSRPASDNTDTNKCISDRKKVKSDANREGVVKLGDTKVHERNHGGNRECEVKHSDTEVPERNRAVTRECETKNRDATVPVKKCDASRVRSEKQRIQQSERIKDVQNGRTLALTGPGGDKIKPANPGQTNIHCIRILSGHAELARPTPGLPTPLVRPLHESQTLVVRKQWNSQETNARPLPSFKAIPARLAPSLNPAGPSTSRQADETDETADKLRKKTADPCGQSRPRRGIFAARRTRQESLMDEILDHENTRPLKRPRSEQKQVTTQVSGIIKEKNGRPLTKQDVRKIQCEKERQKRKAMLNNAVSAQPGARHPTAIEFWDLYELWDPNQDWPLSTQWRKRFQAPFSNPDWNNAEYNRRLRFNISLGRLTL